MIVGICGYARSGKDTAAAGLIKEGFARVAFADALKHDVINALCNSLDEVDGPEVNVVSELLERKEVFRPLLVEYGRALRALQPGHWILRAERKAERNEHTVITDVRYADEAEWVRGTGGIVIGITRPGVGPANEEERESFSKFKPDFEVVNSGSVAELQGWTLGVVTEYMEKIGEPRLCYTKR